METCVIIGGGGHGRMLIDALQDRSAPVELLVLDADALLHGTLLLGVAVVGDDAQLPVLARRGVTRFAVGLGGTRDNQPRRALFESAAALQLRAFTIVHRSAIVSRHAELGAGAQILPGAVVNVGARLGVNVIVNSGAIVEHDCHIGDHAHIATGARLTSTVCVGPGAHIGAGAVVRQCVAIGEGAVVGAGAVVIADVAPWSIVAGVPARPLATSPRKARA